MLARFAAATRGARCPAVASRRHGPVAGRLLRAYLGQVVSEEPPLHAEEAHGTAASKAVVEAEAAGLDRATARRE